MEIIKQEKENPVLDDLAKKQLSRRRFMSWAGVLGATATVSLVACKKDDNNNNNGGVNLGSGDTGILNYAYALEQLEAAFYTQVVASYYTGISDEEKSILRDIRDHEIAHRELFKVALSTSAIQDLEVDFSKVNFTSRDSVLATAKAFEDLGVAAYNGAGPLLQSKDFLALAGKIVSVEARHAAVIRDRIAFNTFVGPDVIEQTYATEISKSPSQVLAVAQGFLKTKINGNNLPS
ncbi:MAG TPA: ferritin-like domain-containing protein [Chitinophagaceae bacterium]|jgi:hypothetical protein|nr:ferritin-like domain-containing protein [Chitinophagaceae bacterium]